jgi:hypothetical protein|tara:strand:- start:134 stop:409 length:276 start_codon:yes stop_codon:yes gene_type:complete
MNSYNFTVLEKIRKSIESMEKTNQIEFAKILLNNNVKLTENNNGIFVNLNILDDNTIQQFISQLDFINNQNNFLNIDENKKSDLENIFFKK